jgi:hypothetical protein
MSKNHEFDDIHIETSLPPLWEQEQTFNDVLYDWMDRAPYLAVAIAVHVVAFFVLQALAPFEPDDQPELVLQAQAPPPPEEEIEEPEPEEPEEIEEIEVDEVVLQDTEVVEEITDAVDESENDQPELPFANNTGNNDVIGIGGGAGGGGGGKIGGRRAGRAKLSGTVNKSLLAALEWLKEHQSPDGSWDADGFADNCDRGGDLCNGDGDPLHDVGLTGLALLAFTGFGDTMKDGEYKDVISAGVAWLTDQQDPDSGLIGEDISKEFIYNHAIATLALAEAYYGDKRPLLKKKVQKAISYILKARNDYEAWRYAVPPNGENDMSVTGWMVFALGAARDVGIDVGNDPFVGSLSIIDELTDSATGRTGYLERGQPSSRATTMLEDFPTSETEAMTAAAVLCRSFIAPSVGQEFNPDDDIVRLGGNLMLETLPEWDEAGGGGGDSGWEPSNHGRSNDMYYWYYGSLAMFQLGGNYWKKWQAAMEKVAIDNQRTDPPCYLGSWDPGGPWGYSGGRVYSTAIMALCLEASLRYTKGFGTR